MSSVLLIVRVGPSVDALEDPDEVAAVAVAGSAAPQMVDGSIKSPALTGFIAQKLGSRSAFVRCLP